MERPPLLSYAQNGEDVVLDRVFAEQDVGFYVDIGACHPVEDSVTLHFYQRGWRGVNVEPDRALHLAFVDAREYDANVCAAVGRTRGRIDFYPTGTRGHGTLNSTIASARERGRPREKVPELLLSDVIDFYGPDSGIVDFLKIDVEGWEAEVIASGDWSRHRPRIVLVEAVDDMGRPTHEAWEPALLGAGYRYGMFDGLNRFYCRDEDADLLLPRLTSPASVLDRWTRASDAHLHEAYAKLQAEHAQVVETHAHTIETQAAAHAAALTAAEQSAIARIETAERGAESRIALAEQEAEQKIAAIQTEAVEVASAHSQSLSAALQRLAEADERAKSLAGELEQAHVDAARTQEELRARRNDDEVRIVELSRARAAAASSLRREERAEARLAELEVDAIRRNSDITSLNVQLDQARQQAAYFQRSAHEHAEAGRALEGELNNRERMLNEIKGQLSKSNWKLTESEAWLEAVRRSTSWRMTKAFRVVGRAVARRFRG